MIIFIEPFLGSDAEYSPLDAKNYQQRSRGRHYFSKTSSASHVRIILHYSCYQKKDTFP